MRNQPPRDSTSSGPIRARFDRFELDEANAALLRDGRPVTVQPTPFAVLCALVRKPGALLTKQALLDQVWGHQFVTDSVLKTAVSDLRKLLGDDPRHPRLIETVSRRGYRFIGTTAAIKADSFERGAVSPSAAPGPPFIGRIAELSRLRSAWETTCNGARTLVWVAGEPGIGKTMLIDHFVAGLGGIACARGQCVENRGAGEPYLPVLEALAELCRSDPAVPAMLRAVAPTWLLQLPWLSTAEERAALRNELAGVGPERMLREMGELLERYTERRPLLLITEDLHWSDRATVRLIDYIARRRGSTRLMWLASFRLAEVVALDHPLNSLRHELCLHGLCEEIILDPFSEAEVAQFVAQRSASLASDEPFVRGLHERTDGVPLFVASVFKDVLARTAKADQADSAAAQLAAVAIPENLTAIIDHYVVMLDAEQRSLLSAAAVCGVEFRVGTITGMLERDAAWVSQTCDDLARERLWLVAPTEERGNDGREQLYAFRHALFRQVLYDRIAPYMRAELHRKAGETLERERAAGTPVVAAELAMHFERCREPLIASRYCAEAAEAALRRLSPAECLSLTERGLALVDQASKGTERSMLEMTLATLRGVSATHALGLGSEAKDAFQRAYALLADLPQHPMRRLLLHGFGFVLSLRAEYAEALTMADRAEALSSASNDPAMNVAACMVQAHTHMLQGRPRDSRTWAERGLAAAESADTAAEEIVVADPQVFLLGLLSIELLHLGLAGQARARLRQAHDRARQLGQPFARMVAIWFDALLEVRLGNAERVAALADEMRALVDEFSLAQGRSASQWFRGWADARMGQALDGYRRIREAYEQNVRLGMMAGGSETLGYAVEALLLAGELDAAEVQLREALQFASTHEERVYLPQLLLLEARIARARGDSALADDVLERAVEEARAQGSPWLELLARLELCERDDASASCRQALAAVVDRIPEAIDTAALGRARALLGRKAPV
jgi:DNA-binding winged helix-turn-helix (wHTH) protein/tetratricopeptide (TPR) repeat protein